MKGWSQNGTPSRKLQKLLSSSVICRRTDVDELPVLLLRVHSVVEQPRKHIRLQARGSFGNILKDRVVKDINPTIHHSWRLTAGLLREGVDSASRIHMNRSVSARILDPKDSHRRHGVVMLSMKCQQALEIDFEK